MTSISGVRIIHAAQDALKLPPAGTSHPRLAYYLAARERAEGLAEGTLKLPKSWIIGAQLGVQRPEDQFPRLYTFSPGLIGTERGPVGYVQSAFALAVGIEIFAKSREASYANTTHYLAAIRDCLLETPLDGVSDVQYSDETYDDGDPLKARTQAIGMLAFVVYVNDPVDLSEPIFGHGFPTTPADIPSTGVPVSSTDVDVDAVD